MADDLIKVEIKNLEQEILDAETQIEGAISQLFCLEDVLKDICQEIKSSLFFDFAGISLVSLERNTIESVEGIGISKDLSGRAKHYLETDKDLRDIQADIVQTRRTKIISGWDRRFDDWIYKEFKHDRIVRVYTPILLIQDENGKIIEDWFERYQWQNIFTREELEGRCRIFEELALPSEFKVIVIGTVEAGYEDRNKCIEDEKVFKLVKFISQKAVDIWKAQLPWVLKIIAENARQIMKADSASLHFLYEPSKNRYIYQVFSGKVGWQFLSECPPRKQGMGRQAILEKKYKYVPDPSQGHPPLELRKLNKKAFASGIRSLAAFPLQVDVQARNLRQEGVLYVQFKTEHEFNEEELRWGQVFANRAADAIRHAMIYEQKREREQQLTTLHSVAQFLSHTPKKDILLLIAWNTLNILGADVVTIYEYIQTEKKFCFPPEIAGKLKNRQEMDAEIDRHNVPFLSVERGENSYVSKLSKNKIFKDAPFSKREGIQSVASILLKVEEEIVGVMFVNYRRSQDFNEEKKQIIETLASAAAIAIKNQRWPTARGEIDRKIITTLNRKELLNLIVEHAVKLTGANFGSIRLLAPDPRQQTLIMEAKYPKNSEIAPNRIETSINVGITGWVARHRKSALVDDVKSEEWEQYYKACFPNVRSELCVPLLDKDGSLLGVLNVECRRKGVLDNKHQQMLEALADQAVIGIQNVKNKEQLVNMVTLLNLGDLAGQLLHNMKSDIGAIREFSIDIIERGDPYSQAKATSILSSADLLRNESRILRSWMNEKPQLFNVSPLIMQALLKVKISTDIKKNIVLASNLPKVLAGRQQLLNVFNNLIQNAVDAMPNGGILSISANSCNRDGYDWIIVEVIDNGIGIEKDNLEMIFQSDYTTKDDGKGTGFGLWWTQFYIQRLGGDVRVCSEPNERTAFSVILPSSSG